MTGVPGELIGTISCDQRLELIRELEILYKKYPLLNILCLSENSARSWNDLRPAKYRDAYLMAYAFCKWWLCQKENTKLASVWATAYGLKHIIEDDRLGYNIRKGYSLDEAYSLLLGYVPEIAVICAILQIKKRSLYRMASPAEYRRDE